MSQYDSIHKKNKKMNMIDIVCEVMLGEYGYPRSNIGHVRAKEDFEKFKAEYYKRFPK